MYQPAPLAKKSQNLQLDVQARSCFEPVSHQDFEMSPASSMKSFKKCKAELVAFFRASALVMRKLSKTLASVVFTRSRFRRIMPSRYLRELASKDGNFGGLTILEKKFTYNLEEMLLSWFKIIKTEK